MIMTNKSNYNNTITGAVNSSALNSTNFTKTINNNDYLWVDNSYSNSISTIGSLNTSDYVINGTIGYNYMEKTDIETQLNILEKYFKLDFLNRNNYEKKLNKEEFLDLVKIYIQKITKYEAINIKFNKDIMLESIKITINNNIYFSIDNNTSLQPTFFLHYNDEFYINTDEFLSVLKKACFNKLLDV